MLERKVTDGPESKRRFVEYFSLVPTRLTLENNNRPPPWRYASKSCPLNDILARQARKCWICTKSHDIVKERLTLLEPDSIGMMWFPAQ